MRTVTACRLDEIADGTCRRVMIEKRPVALVRCGDEVYALLDSCPHFGGPLSGGAVSVKRREIACPWHRFRFHLASGASVTNPELLAQTFAVRVEGGEVLVSLP
ncbi:MAG TPA: Rieske (2Fe-2S) protein [Stellaceae bacterium]|nr:Rieske (2Fe-2S) protein [Stellaceae bacterium]